MTSKREAEAQRARELDEATEAGVAFAFANPEALLVEAGCEASRQFPALHQWFAFYDAVRAARARRDDYLREAATEA